VDDRHPAVSPLVIDQHFPAQVMIEMNFVPRLLQHVEALLDGLHANRTRVGQERRGAIGGVIHKQDTGRKGRWLVHKKLPSAGRVSRPL